MASITVPRGRVLTIGTLSHLTGVNIETIRYYERINLMTKPPRTVGGHRDYQPQHVGRLRFIKRARELGFGIGDIRTLITFALRGDSSCADARKVASAHLTDVRAKLDDLSKLEEILSDTIERCDTQCCATLLSPCPILEALQG